MPSKCLQLSILAQQHWLNQMFEKMQKKHLEWKQNHHIKAYVSAADLLANTAHLWTETM